jgi:mannose-1-phosphate guanylyltransferase/phosphomannomutase
MIKRAMISGFNAAGIDVADLRVLPAAVSQHLLKTHGYDLGFHVGTSSSDPEMLQIRFFEQPGVRMGSALRKEIEKHYTRHELRRVAAAAIGSVTYPARVRESYAQDLLSQLDADAIRRRRFRIVVDYSYSAASYVMPLLFGPLGVEAVTAHGFATERSMGGSELHESIGEAKRLVSAIGGELGVVLDRAGERLWLIDERGREISVEQTLLLFLRLLRQTVREGKAVFPVTVTRLVDEILEGSGLEVVRTQNSLSALTAAAAEEGVVFAGALGGGYVFPEFLPAYDAVASLCKLLELLAPLDRPLSELVADLPASTLLHRQLQCPWALKGLVMRVLNERLAGRELDLTDGIKLFDERGWVQVLPDPDEPVIHLYAEGDTDELSNELEHELREQVEEIMLADSDRSPAPTASAP